MSRPWKKFVSWFVVVATVALVAFDVLLSALRKATYSSRITAWAKKWWWFAPAIVAALAALIGHWFFDAQASWSAWAADNWARALAYTGIFAGGMILGGKFW